MCRLLMALALLIPCRNIAQNTIGFPDILNYAKQEYQGGGQNWDATTDQRGIMYFANTEGLLSFDGHFWKLYPIPNNTRLRSVLATADGRIYVGAQDEFGYFYPGDNGILQYHSLKPLLPSSMKQMADVWDIEEYNNAIWFRTSNMLFELRNNTFKTYASPAEWRKMYRTEKGLYVQDYNDGLMQFDNGQWKTICGDSSLKKMLITSLHVHPDGRLMIATLKDGLFIINNGHLLPWKTEADSIFHSGRIFCSIVLSDQELAIGTTSNGCFIISRENGRVIQHFGMEAGLQNNNVLQLFADKRKNIWLALDNGIDLIRYNTFVKQIYPNKKNMLTSYAAQVFHNKLYIGTSDGVYVAPHDGSADFSTSRSSFSLVPNTKGQVWSLSVSDDQLLLGHHEGVFLINDKNTVPLIRDRGTWLYRQYGSSGKTRELLIGGYNGLYKMMQTGSEFTQPKHIKGLWESMRFITIDRDNTIWCSHPYRGIYRVRLMGDSLDYTLLSARDGLPADYENFVFFIRNRVVIATKHGLYEWNSVTNRFQQSALLYDIFGDIPIQFLREDAYGNIWFVSDKVPAIVDFHKPANGKPYSVVYFPELKHRIVGGFEFIYPYDEENVFLAAEKALYHINYKKYVRLSSVPSVAIGRVKTIGRNDSLIFGGYFTGKNGPVTEQDKDQIICLPKKFNSFRFEFASPAYDQGSNIEYSYRLNGFDKEWSNWSTKPEKEFTNLSNGTYTFLVKARDNLGNESATVSYTFVIWPGWYQTTTAKAVYAFLLLVFLYLLYRMQKRKFANQQIKHKKEQEHLISLHQLELERNEKDLMQVQNEKLESDVMFKNRELATVTMHLVERGKVLSEIKEKLVQAITKHDPPLNIGNFRKVMRLLEEAENKDEDWEHFARHFDEVHSNYLNSVKKHFPSLTTTDLKLCAYLHINLTSKEIAQLMGISVRGVETSRYRLRKKLDIPGETSLNTFLLEAIANDQHANGNGNGNGNGNVNGNGNGNGNGYAISIKNGSEQEAS